MITVVPTKDLEIVRSIITDPALYKAVSGGVVPIDEFVVDKDYDYLLFMQDDVILGCLQTKPLTRLVLDVHIFILSKYWGSGLTKEIADAGHQYIKDLDYTTTFTRVPANCIHVLIFLEKLKYRACGMIPKAIVFNHTLVSLFFFEFEV